MSNKTKPRVEIVVEFLTTSPRLAHAYRYAAKHNKSLNRFSAMHEIGHLTTAHTTVQGLRKGPVEVVVLAHPDDDHVASTDTTLANVLSEAFFLLFTEPTTHPEQIMQWTRRARVRAENRLHVVKVHSLETPDVSQLLGRVCFALSEDNKRGGIIDAYQNADSLFVRGPKHRLLHVPLKALSSLRDKPREAQRKFEIDPDGSFLYWPDLDVHLGWNQFLQAVDPEELRKAQQRREGFNQRYGAAIRTVREAAGVSQSKVMGLTDRQLRRIEQGESRATSKALTALAAAHGLDANAYMEKLAKALK